MAPTTKHDYAESGFTIREAMLDHAKKYPNKRDRPEYILWRGLHVKTSDAFSVPQTGTVKAEFIFAKEEIEQGFDIKVDGWLELAGGEHVPTLRTWKDERYADTIEYPFFSRDGRLWVWNVYRMTYPSGHVIEEKWTENAGFWIEHVSENERIYHCSHGIATPPDFDSLVFKVRVDPKGQEV
jgi:hypothetical protein